MRLPKFMAAIAVLAVAAAVASAQPPVVIRPYMPSRPIVVAPVRPVYTPVVVQVPTTLTYRPSYLPSPAVTRGYAVYYRAYPVSPWVYYDSYVSLRQALLVQDELMFFMGYDAMVR